MKNKKGLSWVCLVMGILFTAFAVIMAVTESEMIFGTKVSNINKLLAEGSIDSNVGSYVEMDIDAVLENFAETVHSSNGITTGKDQHYLVWLDDDSMIAVSVRKKLVEPMNAVMERTWDYLDDKVSSFTDTPLHVKGKIVKMDTELRKYFQETLDYYGISSPDWEIHYYQVDCTDSQIMMIAVLVFFVVMAALMFVLFGANRAAVRREAYEAEMQGDTRYSYPHSYTAYGTGIDDPVSADDMEYSAQDSDQE